MKAGLALTLDPTRMSKDACDFDKGLRRKVIGQDDAIVKLTEVYQLYRAGLHAPGRPVGTLLFLGPTGTGKTRTVEAMAESLYGDPRACIKIDCGEFQHSHEIAKLIGSPPGYLGHRETHPLLTQETINQWHTQSQKLSIILFDEIEKASDSLWKLLLGILDKATLTLGDNRRVDLSQCLIILTSNLGAVEMSAMLDGSSFGFNGIGKKIEEGKGFEERLAKVATDAAGKKFDPEFMNRIDKMVVFKTLKPHHLQMILELELVAVQSRILTSAGLNQFVFKCSDAVKDLLLKEGTDLHYGARHLKRAIEKNLVFPLANLVSSEQVRLGDLVSVDLGPDGKLVFTKEPTGMLPNPDWKPVKERVSDENILSDK